MYIWYWDLPKISKQQYTFNVFIQTAWQTIWLWLWFSDWSLILNAGKLFLWLWLADCSETLNLIGWLVWDSDSDWLALAAGCYSGSDRWWGEWLPCSEEGWHWRCHGNLWLRRLQASCWHDPAGRQLCLNCYGGWKRVRQKRNINIRTKKKWSITNFPAFSLSNVRNVLAWLVTQCNIFLFKCVYCIKILCALGRLIFDNLKKSIAYTLDQ